MKRYVVLTTLVLLLASCASREKMVYLVDIEQKETEINLNYEPKLQPDDVLSIIVSSNVPELVAKFNPGITMYQAMSERTGGQQRLQTYLIDSEGYIIFPVLGKIQLGGLTSTQ